MGVYIRDDNYSDYSAMRGPCPEGYHIPTYSEHVSLINIMQTLEIPYSTDYELYLHMPFKGGMRKYGNGSVAYTTQSSYWSCSKSSNAGYAWYLTGSTGGTTSGVKISNNGYGRRANGNHIRPFRDTPITLDSPNVVSFAQTYSGTGDAGVYEFTLTSGEIVVSITADGVSWITIANKNLGATTMYISGDTASEANCGKFYQWGNNYGFPFSGSITTSSTRVDASSYGPGNYYSSSTFITNSTNPADWSSVQNDNLWGGVTGVKHMSELQNAYIGEYGWQPGANTIAYYPLTSSTTVNDKSGNNRNLTNSNVSFGTQFGVDCAYISGNADSSHSVSKYLYGNITGLPTGSSARTYSFWIYNNNANIPSVADDMYIFQGQASTNKMVFIQGGGVDSRSGLAISQRGSSGYFGASIRKQRCYNVITYDGTKFEWYVNGVSRGTWTKTINTGSNKFSIFGASENPAWNGFNGGMSELILENKVRTAQEVADYYNLTKYKYGL